MTTFMPSISGMVRNDGMCLCKHLRSRLSVLSASAPQFAVQTSPKAFHVRQSAETASAEEAAKLQKLH